jgi:hypothetical protein
MQALRFGPLPTQGHEQCAQVADHQPVLRRKIVDEPGHGPRVERASAPAPAIATAGDNLAVAVIRRAESGFMSD